MKRASLGVSAVAIAALAITPLAVTVPAHATGAFASAGTAAAAATATGRHRPDRAFTPTERRQAIATAQADRGSTARALRLGDREGLVVKDVARDADGTEHVRYDRTYAGLPVIGGDLVVAESPQGAVRTATWATQHRIALKTTQAAVSGSQASSRAPTRSRG